eukprot:gene1133-669_t
MGEFRSKKDRRAFFRAQAAVHKSHESLVTQLSRKAKETFAGADGQYDEFPPSVCSWEELPKVVDPGLYLPDARCARKRAQLDHMVRAFAKLLQKLKKEDENNDQLVAVDFCSGGGHLGLLLAACFPEIKVICLERNERNCDRIEERKVEGGLENVDVLCADVADALTIDRFDIGVAIHACGWMTDFVHAICLKRSASYVLCSCCVGKLASPGPPDSVKEHVSHPRSEQFKKTFTNEQFLDMCKKADMDFYLHLADDDNTAEEAQDLQAEITDEKLARRLCKTAVEVDRNAWAREHGYETCLLQMPSWATPKNDIIVGWQHGD